MYLVLIKSTSKHREIPVVDGEIMLRVKTCENMRFIGSYHFPESLSTPALGVPAGFSFSSSELSIVYSHRQTEN